MNSKRDKTLRACLPFLFVLFLMVDTSFSANTTLLGRWAGGRCRAVYARNDTVYFGSGDTLKIVDFTEPATPVEVGSVILPEQLRDIVVNSNYIYVADWNSGLRIIDISDPAIPTEISSYQFEGVASKIAVRGCYAYLADGINLRILDITDPANPSVILDYDHSGNASTDVVVVVVDFAYILDYWGILSIVDISDPTAPVWLGQSNIGEAAQGLAIQGDYAYGQSFYGDGLQIINISDPTNPTLAGFDDKYTSYGLDVSGAFAYIADGGDGLWIVDIRTPAQPVEVGDFNTGSSARDVFVSGRVAYVASYDAGLYVIRNDVVLEDQYIPEVVWNQTYEGSIYDFTNTSDGGYILTGELNESVLLIKTDAAGDTLWIKAVELGTSSKGASIKQTSDGGFIIAGSITTSTTELFLLKTNQAGDSLWTRTYGSTSSYMNEQRVQETMDGGFLIAGVPNNLIKTNLNGEMVWTRAIRCASAIQASDGNYVIAASVDIPVPDWEDSEAISWLKINENGDTLWFNHGNVVDGARGTIVSEAPNGGFIVLGYETIDVDGGPVLYRVGSSGEIPWRQYPPTGEIYSEYYGTGSYVVPHRDGTFLTARSFIYEHNYPGSRGQIGIFDDNGTLLWEAPFMATSFNQCVRVLGLEEEDGFLTVGISRDADLVTTTHFIKKVDFNEIPDDPPEEPEIACLVDTTEQPPDPDPIPVPEESSLDNNFPNPFNSSTTISYAVKAGGIVTIRVYDLSGAEIQTLLSEFHDYGTYEVVFNGLQLPSGIYFYHMQTGNGFSQTKKMGLIK